MILHNMALSKIKVNEITWAKNNFPQFQLKSTSIKKGHRIQFVYCTVNSPSRVTKIHRRPHRALKYISNIRFCNRLLSIQAIILDQTESNKCCLNSCRNRNLGHKIHKNLKCKIYFGIRHISLSLRVWCNG